MADFILSLGDVDFESFEIPDAIKDLGGAQSLQIKKYGGGLRTINAFGSDDTPLTWSGIFFDDTAEARCQALDAMRIAGSPVSLSFSSFSYEVTISKFSFDFVRFYEIHYSITLEVVSDDTQPITDDSDDTESTIQSDFGDANTYSNSLAG